MSRPSAAFTFPTVAETANGRPRFEDRRDMESSGSTPLSAFASLASTSAHITSMQTMPEPTIVVEGKRLAASPGFGAKVVFRAE